MGYNVNDVFPSKYLSSSDLQGRTVEVIIEAATQEQMKDGEFKLCLHFRGKKKSMLLNKTNAKRIAEMYGDHTDGWLGQPIMLVVAEVEYQGDTVQALRVKPPAAMTQAARQAAGFASQAPANYQPAPVQTRQPPAQEQSFEDALDDEIPF